MQMVWTHQQMISYIKTHFNRPKLKVKTEEFGVFGLLT